MTLSTHGKQLDGTAVAWLKVYQRRLNWAEKGRELFVSQLDPGVRDLYLVPSGARPIVLTYGGAQVGKTSVLLHLLGVDPNQNEVERVLRGGRAAGESASATAILYDSSTNDEWCIQARGVVTETADDSNATEVIASLRRNIEIDPEANNSAVRISIPARYIVAPAPCLVMDFPGIGGRDVLERQHVDRLMKRWLPQAGMIVIVVRKNNISDLEAIQAELLNGLPPSRCRIVVTYAISSSSDRSFLKQEWDGTLLTWQARLREELDRTLASPLPDLDIYPFEVGQSRRALRSSDPELEDRVIPMLNESAELFRKGMQITREALLVQQVAFHRYVQTFAKSQRQLRKEKIRQLGCKIEGLQNYKRTHQEEFEAATVQLEKVKDELAHCERLRPTKIGPFFPPAAPAKDYDVAALITWTDRLEQYLQRKTEQLFDRHQLLAPRNVIHQNKAAIQALRTEVSKYFGFWTTHRTRLSVCATATAKLAEDFLIRLAKALESELSARLAGANAAYRKTLDDQQSAAVHINQLERDIEQFSSVHRNLCIEDAKRWRREEQDINRARRFREFLDKAWLAEKRRIDMAIHQSDNPSELVMLTLEKALLAKVRGELSLNVPV